MNRFSSARVVVLLVVLLLFSGGPCTSAYCCAEKAGHSNHLCTSGALDEGFLGTDGDAPHLADCHHAGCHCRCSGAHLPPVLLSSSYYDDELRRLGTLAFCPAPLSAASFPHVAKVLLADELASNSTLRSITSTIIII